MSSLGTILVIDDEKNIRRTLTLVLEGEGFDVIDADCAEAGLAVLTRRQVDAVMLDVCMPGMDGLAALKIILSEDAELPVVMISGHASINDAVEATRLGAFDFLEKPLGRERVLLTIRNCLRARRKTDEIAALRLGGAAVGSEILGEAAAILALKKQISRVAPTRGRVLITGESGTGKELIARAIHQASDRKAQPFIKVNCAAIPDELIESTLFGHEKGAFTSAVGKRRGHFELAHNGTLFLDEIGDMSLAAQAKVLRVLQSGEMSRVGGERTITVDARVIAATNKDLETACREGTFREDLFFRLNVVPLLSPPLRARRDDVPTLAVHFLAEICRENGFANKRFHSAVIKRLSGHEWPGNVRELRNMVERLAILSDIEIIEADLPSGFGGGGGRLFGTAGSELFETGSLRAFREAAERAFVEARLEANAWNISRTAGSLGLERTNLHKKMKALGIQRKP